MDAAYQTTSCIRLLFSNVASHLELGQTGIIAGGVKWQCLRAQPPLGYPLGVVSTLQLSGRYRCGTDKYLLRCTTV